MTWIKTVTVDESEEVRKAVESQRELYPIEYATPVHPTPDGETAGIVASHSLIPQALYHAFATFGSLMSPDLPLTGRQHEMISRGGASRPRARLPQGADPRAGEGDARLRGANPARRAAHPARRSRTVARGR